MSWLLLCRVLHIAATCTSLGGLVYARMVLWPSLPLLPEPERSALLKGAIQRFAWIKWSGVVVVAVTGAIQWIYVWPQVSDRGLYVVYFLVKMVGALGLLTVTFLLALPAPSLRGMQRFRAFWSGVNILSGSLILIGAALMRTVVKNPAP